MHILNKTNIDFMRWRWHAVALSWIVILAGLGVIMTRGLPRGIEFAGGTSVILQFDTAPSDDAVREALNRNYPGGGQDAIVQTYGAPTLRTKMIRVPHVGEESGASLSSTSESVEKALRAANLGNFSVVGTEIVGPAVGKELSQRGLIATVLSLVGLLLYIAFRYQLSFAVGAVVATIHDLLIVVAFLAFFRYDLTLNVIAAILTVTGYSTNDTIVIFDRVRENLRGMRKDNLMDVINTSINQTLGRTVLTGGLTLLSVVALFLFGGEVLRGFAFTMIIGIITGTYSSIFVAAAVVTFWRGVGPTRAALAGPAVAGAVASGASQQPTRKSGKTPRKVRAS
jgi:preprotein translocase subunit SecF